MRTTDEVIEAVRIGGECTDEELRYAVRNLSIWQNGLVFPLARAVTEEPLSPRTKRDLQRAYDSMWEGNKVPLDKRLKGGSFEPGISDTERRDRFTAATSSAATKFAEALTELSARSTCTAKERR